MQITMDKAGRVVLPREVRLKAALEPGVPLEVTVRDGVVELTPAPTPMKRVKKGVWTVAVPAKPIGKLTQKQVNDTLDALRSERG